MEASVRSSGDLAARRPPSGPVASWTERLDVLVHALAQLPDDVTLTIDGDGEERQRLELLTRAYAISDRVTFLNGPGALGGSIYRSRMPGGEPGVGAAGRASIAELIDSLSLPDDGPAEKHFDDAVFGGERVALVTNYPAHYRLPLLREVSERLRRTGGSLAVVFLSRGAAARSWLASEDDAGVDHRFARSIRVPGKARPVLVPLDLGRTLDRLAPTLVLAAGFSPLGAGRVARFAARRRIPFGIWSGETASMATARGRIRGLQRAALTAKADFAISYGFASGEYLHALRPELPLVHGRNTAPIADAAERRADGSATVEVLVVGDLATPRKGVDVALEALRRVPRLDCRLTVIGGGKLFSTLQRAAEADRRIHFAGALQPDRVRAAYRSSDIVLFPTRADVFGLVLVEAMGAGCAVIVSSSAGAVADLAVNEQNCLVTETHDPAVWAEHLTRLVRDEDLRRRLGEHARGTIVRRWTIGHAADAMLAGLRLGLLVRNA